MSKLLENYKEKFEAYLVSSLATWNEAGKLSEACEYALLNGGKRVRPIIVMMLAEALGKDLDVLEACLSVEFFHTASLIVDDLPCMDNDDFRRNQHALHKAYGETTALLASYALITEAFGKIYTSAKVLNENSKDCHLVCSLALESAAKNSGISGATLGQFLDLFSKKRSIKSLREVIEKKTITLFESSFVFGWLFGGGDPNQMDDIKKAAYHFGMAFQIADDLDDLGQDAPRKENANLAQFLGLEKAFALFQDELETFEEIMQKNEIYTPEFEELTALLQASAGSSIGATP